MKYVILSLQRMIVSHFEGPGNAKWLTPVFWKPDGLGYTTNPFEAGLYSKDQFGDLSLSYADIIIPIDRLHSIGFGVAVRDEELNSLVTGHDGGMYKELIDEG